MKLKSKLIISMGGLLLLLLLTALTAWKQFGTTPSASWVMAGMAIALFVSMGSMVWLWKDLAGIESLGEYSKRLAGGDLSSTFAMTGAGEIGEIAQSMTLLRGQLQHQVGDVLQQSSHLVNFLGQLSEIISHCSGGASRQVEYSEEIAQAIDELNGSIQDIAQKVSAAADKAQESLDRARAGNESISKLMGEIDQVEGSFTSITDVVDHFVKSTQTISSMTRQVKDIADQTNLLALNAAIEAARAGEQGRGFAVVADEVRKLAEKSALAAHEIDEVTKAINGQSETVGAAIDTGRSYLNMSMETLEDVAMALAEANGSISEEAAVIVTVASTTQGQSVTSDKITQGIDNIASMARESGSNIDQTVKSVDEARQLAESMYSLMKGFRLQ